VRTLTLLLILWAGAGSAAENGCPRIISQSPYVTHTLEWLELKGCIVGTSRYDTLGLPTTGGVMDPDAEAIEMLQPELIFTSRWTDAELLQLITPDGASSFRLGGFKGMAEVEQNLTTIGDAAGIANTEAKAAAFSREWQTRAKAVAGEGRRILLLSACSTIPYSYGPNTWLHDLFTTAGFHNVERFPRLRHLRGDGKYKTVAELIDGLKPELIFSFTPDSSRSCSAIPPRKGVKIISLSGKHFLHPAPGPLLKGLDELAAKRVLWAGTEIRNREPQ